MSVGSVLSWSGVALAVLTALFSGFVFGVIVGARARARFIDALAQARADLAAANIERAEALQRAADAENARAVAEAVAFGVDR